MEQQEQPQQQQEIKEFEAININISDLVFDEANPNQLTQEQMHGLREAMKRFGYLQPIIIDQNNKIADGEHRVLVYKEFNMQQIPAYKIDFSNDSERKLLRQAMNKIRGTHDPVLDAQELQFLTEDSLLPELAELIGKDQNELKRIIADYHPEGVMSSGIPSQDGHNAGALALRWGIPPFSVLDRRTLTWQARRRQWLDFGIASQAGREKTVLYANHIHMRVGPRDKDGVVNKDYLPTASVFDPVIAEIMIRWFCIKTRGARILDPFAGGSVRGIVSSFFGHEYIGIDLRAEQIEANNKQYAALEQRMPADHIKPKWICGDSLDIATLVANDNNNNNKFDFVLTSPPYFHVEKYSNLDQDLNNMSLSQFTQTYKQIIHETAKLVNKDTFICWNVGNARDPKTRMYMNQQDLTKQAFAEMGFYLQNELVLIHPTYSLPFRVNNMFLPKRTIPKQHEYILIFYNGSHEEIQPIDPMIVDIPNPEGIEEAAVTTLRSTTTTNTTPPTT